METFSLLNESEIEERDGWFYASHRSRAYDPYCGGDLGQGSSQTTTRFQSHEAAIYYLRAESFRRQLNRAISETEWAKQQSERLQTELNAIPAWIRKFYATPEEPEAYPNG